ncbi:MAG TPA: ACT domain-containing protein [Polyangiaceae bacterium]|nr:ACT domain-containing protein [Polyangiaceae bacterium]
MTARSYRVLTAVGPDRPGLVQEISTAIHEASANLEDSRMAILGGEFALIVLVSGDDAAIRAVSEKAPALGKALGLAVSLKETTRAAAVTSAGTYRLHVEGVDRPGIVASVSRVIASRGVNVASLESRVVNAPESGTPIFVLSAELHVPADVPLAAIASDLSAACDADDLEFSLDAV